MQRNEPSAGGDHNNWVHFIRKNTMKRVTLLAGLFAGQAMLVGAASAQVNGYAVASDGSNWRSSYGQCWRAGYWTPALATEACDPDLVPKAAAPAPAPVAAAPVAPAPAAKPVFERATFSVDVLFEFDKAVLKEEGQRQLDALASQISAVQLDVVVAVGHADRIGGVKYNQKLSERRANAIKDYLVSKGIAANRVYAEGKGEAQPVTGDKCRKMGPENKRNTKLIACLQPDRRVEIEVVGTRQK